MGEKNIGSSIEDFLRDEGIFEEAQAVKEVTAWQIVEARKKANTSEGPSVLDHVEKSSEN